MDADIHSFFDTIDHEWMMKFMEHRIADQRLLRLIRKWLRAGVSEDGQWSKTTVGTPQGAVISNFSKYLSALRARLVGTPMANQACCREVIIVRYADDVVMGFQHRKEAERFLQELGNAWQNSGWNCTAKRPDLLSSEGSQQRTGQYAAKASPKRLTSGFYTYLCRTRKGDRFTVRRKTIAKRLRGK